MKGAQIKSIISYFTLIGWIIAFLLNQAENKESEASFHLRQSLGLNLLSFILAFAVTIFSAFPFIGWLAGAAASLIMVVFWVLGFINALTQQKHTIPIIGSYFNNWFKDI